MARTILIVDDLALNRRILRSILSRDYDILEAGSGSEALSVLARGCDTISAVLLDINMPETDGFAVLRAIRADAALAPIPVIMITGSEDEASRSRSLDLGANDFVMKPYNPDVIRHCLQNNIALREAAATVYVLQRDRLTGLYNRGAFFDKVQELTAAHEPGYYVMACFDIDKLKVVNDQYGTQKGDELLRHIAGVFERGFEAFGGVCCRVSADDFAVLYPAAYQDSPELEQIREQAGRLDGLLTPVTFCIGRYIVNDPSMSPSAMYDRAMLAGNSVKGRYDVQIACYDESMRDKLLHEQRIVTEMESALRERQFEAWYQPQYNHSTGALIGAEALVRWRHPERGLIAPGLFIPIFEKNGFVYELDKYVWEEVCRFLRRELDEGAPPLPVSVNISRQDVFRSDLVDTIARLTARYAIPAELLRLEITESAFAESTRQIVDTVQRFIDLGFTVEIDDFGSGYSSLNTLKDVPAQILKLDMRFLENSNSQRGGNILESVVRMTKWLGMSVIAEGVETRAQADYLRSIGCNYIQGYLYAKPMPAEEYRALCRVGGREEKLLTMETVENLDNLSFWDPASMDTLIFNSFVGAACIFEYHKGGVELLRTTEKYAQMLGSAGMGVEDALRLNWMEHLDEATRRRVAADLEVSAATKREVAGEYVFLDLPGCAHETYLRSTMRVIAVVGERYLVYCTNENISAQRAAEQSERRVAEQMQAIMDNVGLGITAVTLAPEGARFLFANDQYFEMLGFTRALFEAEIRDPFELIAPEDIERVREAARALDASGSAAVLEYRALRRDGSSPWFRAALSMARFAGVEEPVQLAILRDISEEKQSEQELRESDDQLRFLNEAAHELLAQPDSDRGIDDSLRRLLDYFGGARAYVFEFDHERGIANNSYEICAAGVTSERENLQNVPMEIMAFWLHAFEREKMLDIADVDALGEERAEERAVLQAQGIRSLIAVPLQRDGQLLGFIGIDDPRAHSRVDRLAALGDYIAVMLTRRDLSARIRSDNRSLTAMMNDIPGGFVRMRVQPDGGIRPVYFNDGFLRLTGMDHDAFLRLYDEDAFAGVHPEDVALVREAVAQMLERGEASSARYRLRRGGGGYVWLKFFGRRTRDLAGDTFLNVYYMDATQQAREEERQKELLDNLPCGGALYEYDGERIVTIHLNRRYLEMVGQEIADYAGYAALDAVYPDDRPVMLRELTAAIRQGRDAACDYRVRCGDGTYRAFHVAGRIVPREDGKYALYAAYTPLADEAMSYQEMLPVVLSTIMESTSDLSFAKDREFRYICASSAFARMVGLSGAQEVMGKTDYDLFPPEIADKYRHDDETLLAGGQAIVDMVEALPAEQGVSRYSSTSKYLLRDAAGAVIGLYGVGRDVTQTLEKDSQLRFVNDSIPGGLALYHYTADAVRIVYCNDAFCRLFGGSGEGFRQRGDFDPMEWVFEEYRAQLAAQNAAMLRDGTPSDCTFRVHVLGGGYRWVHFRAVAAERRAGSVLVNAVLLDITERENALERLRISEEENRLALQLGGNVVCRYTVADRSLSLSEEAAEFLQIPETALNVPDEPVARGMISPESVDAYVRFFEDILRGEPTGSVVFQQRYSDDWRWLEGHSATVFSADGKPAKAVIALHDVTEQLEKEAVYKKWQQSLEEKDPASYTLFRCNLSKDASFDTMEGSLLQVAFDGSRLDFNDRTQEYVEQCVYEEDREKYAAFLNSDALLAGYYRGKRSGVLEYRERTQDGGLRWLRLSADLVEYPNSSDVEIYLMYEDISEAKRSELQTREQAETDPLTGVMNRGAFVAAVERALREAKPGACHALLMLDVDGFKQVNDVFGHGAGDQALIDIAAALRAVLRHDDLLGRLGGDEFLVFLSDIPGDAIAANKARQMCENTRKAFSLEVQISGSVGIAAVPRDGADFETLYKKADSALYYVKGSGKNNFAFYRENMADEHLAPEAEPAPGTARTPREKKRRLLIVDDSALDHALLSRMFEDEFLVEKARDGNSALVRLRHYGSAISAVLLDLMMPGLDGFAVLKKMRASAELSAIPVIVVSGDDSREACLRTIHEGATDFVTKPVDAELLRIRVRSAVSKAENERLRAKNSYLELRSEERAHYETALESAGVMMLELTGPDGAYLANLTDARAVAGVYDGRLLWQILAEDGVAQAEDVQRLRELVSRAAESGRPAFCELPLKTPAGRTHRFRANVQALPTEQTKERLLLTLLDLELEDAPE